MLPASTAFRLPEMRMAALRERVARRGMARENPRWYGREVEEELPELPRAPAPEDYPVVASQLDPRKRSRMTALMRMPARRYTVCRRNRLLLPKQA